MAITNETLNILIFLIPGFLSSLIYNTVVARSKKDSISKIVEALTFSLVNYSIVYAVVGQSPVVYGTIQEENTTKQFIQYNSTALLPITLIAIMFPLILGWFSTNDRIMSLLRRFRITNKTARETIWLDVFTDQKRYIIVHLKDGRRIHGWPMYFSDASNEAQIYLHNPAWIDNGNLKYVDLGIHGMFIVGTQNINFIEFLLSEKERRIRKNVENSTKEVENEKEN